MHRKRGDIRRAAAALLAVLALGTAGCATVRRAREAQRPERVPAGERTATAAELGLGSNTVLNLDAALRTALVVHPAVTQARQGVVAASAQVAQVRSAVWPSLDASAGYRRNTSNAEGAPQSGSTRGAYSGSLGASLLVYDFGRTPARIRAALERQAAAEENLRAAWNDVAYAVRTAFYSLAQAQELVRVGEEAVAQYQVHLEQVKAFVSAGTRTRYDATKAEVDLGNAQMDLITARNQVRTSRVGLNRSLGLAEDPGYRLGESPSVTVDEDAAKLMAQARERHPELRALRAAERAASAAVDEAIAALYPSLNLRGEFSEGGGSFPLVWNWSAALNSAVNLFNGGQNTAAIDEAVAQLRIARARTAEREQRVYLELNDALSLLDTSRQKEALSGLILRQARESLELVQARYRVGKGVPVEVTDAEVAATRAQADQVQARFGSQAAAAQIRHAVGEDVP